MTSHQDISGKADKVTSATNGNFAGLDANGNLTDSGSKASDFLTSHQDISGKADKADTVLTTTLSMGRKASTAVGINSTALGSNVIASGNYSHAEGDSTTASGAGAHAEGYSATASAMYSHAEGVSTTASGSYSSVHGLRTVASHRSQYVFGENNVTDPSSETSSNRGNYVEIVGNGTISDKSNARALDWDGNEYLKGDVYVGCGADSTNGTKLAKLTDLASITYDSATNELTVAF